MPDDIRQTSDLRALRRSAYEELNLAIDQSGGQLPGDWLREGDRDLQSLRDVNEPEWMLLVRRQTGKPGPEDPQFPSPAWGDPHRRRNEWAGVSVLLVVIAGIVALAFLPDEGWFVLAGIAVAIVLALVFAAGRHRWLILGGIAVAAVALYGLYLAPRWVPATLILLVAAGAAAVMAVRAHSKAEEAEKRSIALWSPTVETDAQRPDGGEPPRVGKGGSS